MAVTGWMFRNETLGNGVVVWWVFGVSRNWNPWLYTNKRGASREAERRRVYDIPECGYRCTTGGLAVALFQY